MRAVLSTKAGRFGFIWEIGVLVFCGAACDVTNGSGELHGQLNVPACSFKGTAPIPIGVDTDGVYRKSLDFFVGEPYDSTSVRFPANQLNIRAQNSSAREEFADFLQLWILDSYEVGRCILGNMNPDGSPDWDQRYCDRSSGALSAAGDGRMFIGTENEIITGAYVLYQSCTDLSAANALGDCKGGSCPDLKLCPGRGSWISFSNFGKPVLDGRTGHLGRNFKVENGELITSPAVHLELCDKGTVDQTISGTLPIPVPQITGTLDGSFQFNLRQDLR